MNFLSLSFFAFIAVFLVLYSLTPNRFKYIVLLIGNYFFYCFAGIKVAIFLLTSTLITYLGGIIINKTKKKSMLLLFFILNLLLLATFKYADFFLYNANLLLSKFIPNLIGIKPLGLILPIGLSFYIFQSCTYLADVYKGKIECEKNLLLYASFVSFFPTILSGPIQKSRDLLPQIKNLKNIEFESAREGTLLFVWGAFEKIVVANNLITIFNPIYSNYQNESAIKLLIAAIAFSFYIYADFSSYSDMAIGISRILGVSISRNFDNPYLSTSVSEFWKRWHISLNKWFVEYIYIPMGGSRKGTFRKILAITTVFLVSGLWHGASWHFVFWGLLNGLFVIVGQQLSPVKTLCYNKLNIDEKSESVVWLRRIIVFFLMTFAWIFFQNGIGASISIIKKISLVRFYHFFDDSLFSLAGSAKTTMLICLSTFIFAFVQYKRQHHLNTKEKIIKQPIVFQCFAIALVMLICLIVNYRSGAEVNTQFLYFQF